MSFYKCPRCEKQLSSNQRLHQHLDKKKPCVPENIKTKYRCNRCLKYLSTNQKLTDHKNRKKQCEIHRNEPVIKTEIMKEIELIMEKDKMLMEMKIEYKNELLKIYKQYNNIAVCIKKKKILKDNYIKNIKKLKEYKLMPAKMLSVIPEKKIEVDTVENLMTYIEILQKRIKKAENTIDNFEDEQEDHIIGLNNILNDVCNDREKVCKIKKQLAKMADKHKLYNMTK